MNNKIIFCIGLPGSGKSTLANMLWNNKKDFLHSDWGWKFNINEDGEILGSFSEDYRFEELMNQIKLEKKKNFIIDGSSFCNHGFLCKSEHYLNLNFPGIEIQKYYFENNPKDAIANVLYREHAGGNHWKKLENGEYMFYGHHCVVEGPDKGKRQYEVISDNINKLSKNYNIPLTYTPLQIKVQNEEFYEGWKKLIKK
tara:strand:+ start:135 stop:728 length:594 start_codon:yes stop_codon:yes gene_type:complete